MSIDDDFIYENIKELFESFIFLGKRFVVGLNIPEFGRIRSIRKSLEHLRPGDQFLILWTEDPCLKNKVDPARSHTLMAMLSNSVHEENISYFFCKRCQKGIHTFYPNGIWQPGVLYNPLRATATLDTIKHSSVHGQFMTYESAFLESEKTLTTYLQWQKDVDTNADSRLPLLYPN